MNNVINYYKKITSLLWKKWWLKKINFHKTIIKIKLLLRLNTNKNKLKKRRNVMDFLALTIMVLNIVGIF